jgi:hypothetical protein
VKGEFCLTSSTNLIATSWLHRHKSSCAKGRKIRHVFHTRCNLVCICLHAWPRERPSNTIHREWRFDNLWYEGVITAVSISRHLNNLSLSLLLTRLSFMRFRISTRSITPLTSTITHALQSTTSGATCDQTLWRIMTFEARDLSVLTLASVEASREALNK